MQLKPWKLISLNAGWLGLSFMWNSLHVILLPAALLMFINPERKNTALGLLTGAGLLIAMLIQPVAGAISDRWCSRWGRRRPLILIGTVFDLLFLSILGFAGGLPGLVIGYIGLQFSSNFAHAPLQGLLPDILPKDQLGRGSGFKNLFDMFGLVLASLGMAQLVSPDAVQVGRPVGLIMAVLLVSVGITLIWTREQSTALQASQPRETTLFQDLAGIDLRKNRAFAWLILSRLVFLIGVYGIQAFAQYYVRDTLPGVNPVQLTGNLMATIVLALTACSLLGGYLSDRVGSRPVHTLAAILVAAGCLLMMTAHNASMILVCGLIIGCGIGFFLTANWALSNQLAPTSEAGKYLGLTNLATAGAGALSRLFGP
ncbi:MAG TPA: MFS transporter, partial [Candidatus Methylomirabilis sp.]|nr:MFS transporter [Candidatus Methylomirabilis sp.]